MGSERHYDGVRKASASSIEIDFYYEGARCRERLRLQPTPANMKKAARHRAAIIEAIDQGVFDYSITFPRSKNAKKFMRQDRMDNYLRQWLERKEPAIKASTFNDYCKIVEGQLIPIFGTLLLGEFKRKHAREFAAAKTCSNKRIANILSVLRSALDDAVYDELIDANPIAGWHYQRQDEIKKGKPDPFTREEQNAILVHLSPSGRPIIEFAFWSGLRTSELVALEWNDINMQKCTCRIERALTQAAKGRMETTKTAAGTRTIDLLPRAISALKDQYEISGHHISGRVFLNPRTGEPWNGDQAIRKTLWQPALISANVRYRRPYQTRHTYASMMVSAGEPLAWVSRQMGHSDVIITAKVYSQWIPRSGRRMGVLADELYGKLSFC